MLLRLQALIQRSASFTCLPDPFIPSEVHPGPSPIPRVACRAEKPPLLPASTLPPPVRAPSDRPATFVMFLDLLTPLLTLAKCVPVTLRIKPKFLTTAARSCVKRLPPPLPHHDSARAFSPPLQHPKLPSRGRSQLKWHLLKDNFGDPLNQSRPLSILLTLG